MLNVRKLYRRNLFKHQCNIPGNYLILISSTHIESPNKLNKLFFFRDDNEEEASMLEGLRFLTSRGIHIISKLNKSK